MTCPNCQLYRDHGITRGQANCIWDGARLIQYIQALRIQPASKSARCKEVLATWVEWGHNEQEVRRLAKGSIALEPLPETKKTR